MEEKRKYVRSGLKTPISYRPLNLKGLEKDSVSRDISGGGLSLFVDKKIEKDQPFSLKISLPDDCGPVLTEGKVLWLKKLPQGNLAGLRFCEIGSLDRSRIISLVSKEKEKALLKAGGEKIIFFEEAELESKEELRDLIIHGAGSIERGLKILDKEIDLAEAGTLDILALSPTGQLVVMELATDEDTPILTASLNHLDWVMRNVQMLKKVYHEQIDFHLSPRIILIAPRFSQSFKRQVLNLKPLDIQVIEYRCLEVEGKKGLFLNGSKTKDMKGAVTEEPTAKTEESPLLSIEDFSQIDEQRKRILGWLWNKR